MKDSRGEHTRLITSQLLLPILDLLIHLPIRVLRLGMGELDLKRGLLVRNVYVESEPLFISSTRWGWYSTKSTDGAGKANEVGK
jgi:hypothetical protein